MCLKKSVNYYTNSFVVLVLHVEFSGSFGYTCPSGFLVPIAYIFRQTKYQKTFSERLLRAGSISRFSSFRYVPTPKGVFAKPRDHHQQPFRAFLATMLGLLSSLRLGFTDHLVVRGKLAGHTVLTHHFCFQIPLSVRHWGEATQTLAEEAGTQTWAQAPDLSA